MRNLGSELVANRDAIVKKWVESVAKSRQIESANHLSRAAIRDHIPSILDGLATVLSSPQEINIEAISSPSLQHGFERAEQGFDPVEVVQEYRILRTVILSHLQTELLKETPEELFRVLMLINNVIDEAIAQCLESYMRERLQELENLQSQLQLHNEEFSRLFHSSQDNFSYLVQELKTPLNSIIGYSELFLRQQRQTESKNLSPSFDHIERVLRNGRHLLRLINDSLELSRYDAGQMQPRLAPVVARSILNAVVEVTQSSALAKGLQLILNCEQAPEQVITDPFRLQQLLSNLVSNAIQHTETGSITITCSSPSNQQWVIEINDTGMGIPLADQPYLFDPFARSTPPDQLSTSKSTGLELAIVTRLAKLLQGELQLTSEVGKGTSFTLCLPIQATASP